MPNAPPCWPGSASASSSPLAEPWLQSGALVTVLAADEPEPWPIHVYRPQRAPVPARVRLVYDALVRALR